MIPYAMRPESRVVRVSLGVFALLAVSMLLAVAWLRSFVPAARHAPRLRDVSWLQLRGR